MSEISKGSVRSGKVPFGVSRASREPLVMQVAGGLKACILSGYYKVGDILPATRDLAQELGVSHIVTRGAVKILADAGLISPKPSIGCVVLGGRGKLWKGRVLFVFRNHGQGYFENVLVSVLRERLVKDGYLVVSAVVSPDKSGKIDVSELEIQLMHPVDMAVVVFDNPPAVEILERRDVPYLQLGDGRIPVAKKCVGYVKFDRRGGADDFAQACVKAGVRNVEEVGFERFDDVTAALEARGVTVTSWTVGTPDSRHHTPEAFALKAREKFAARLASGKPLPDLFYFSDDYLCIGALAAMQKAGVAVPGDVRIATWANAGNVPVCACLPARIMLDPAASAEKIFKIVGRALKKEKFECEDIRSVFHDGESVARHRTDERTVNQGGKP